MIDRDARCLPQFRALCELGFEVPSEVIQVFDHISYRTGKHVGTRCISPRVQVQPLQPTPKYVVQSLHY